ncbi:hypothetical protein LXD69_03130 [Flavobacterium sediminilitoris]|uniref:Bacteriocin-like protein n=1 Tax=Flavobacterium sediminilitoris TaxID=2024526 RepID=A0ABY4HNR7_9FLAO|nr:MULTISPECIES: hypothetical protein [Flavobacterium]UOX34512.1 hypothetical protein LXD69_03130 [Flavobacterium sediminilitoris]
MKKSILNLVGAQELSKKTQKEIVGGLRVTDPIGASFPCYCNGVFKKNCDTVQCCVSACGL